MTAITVIIVLLAVVAVLQLATLSVVGRALRMAQGTAATPAVASGAVPVVEAAPARAPVDLRPDPTARFNVYRIDEHGQLALNDVQRYSGNNEAFAAQALQAYEASEWRGRVLFYEHNQQRTVLD